MNKTEALKLALEAIELHLMYHEHGCTYLGPVVPVIKEALAQPEQEPDGWQWMGTSHYRKHIPKDAEKYCWKPLYTTPPKREWVELTAPEIAKIVNAHYDQPLNLALVIETKLKEKNT